MKSIWVGHRPHPFTLSPHAVGYALRHTGNMPCAGGTVATINPDPVIRVVGVSKVFGLARVLEGVSLDVHGGETVGLLGPNGTGKTTLLKILATVIRPTRGAARVAGHDCTREREHVRREVGLLAHESHLYNDLTAMENLAFWQRFAGERVRTDSLRAVLAEVELDDCADLRVRTFSAGMKRRLSLARLCLGHPRVLLLDEPFSSLDQRARKWLEQYLQAFAARGGTILMATHAFGRELDVADRLVILVGGRIIVDAPRGTMTAEEIHRFYTLHTEEAS
jgi:heme ABC exporter ATP-binding subunit CcmA